MKLTVLIIFLTELSQQIPANANQQDQQQQQPDAQSQQIMQMQNC